MSDGQNARRFDQNAAQWLTVSEAARVLGVSERQARRYAARLSPADRQEEPDTAPDMTGQEARHMTAPRPSKRPARVRLEAMQASSKRETILKEPDVGAGHEAGHAPDIMTEEAGHMTAEVSDQLPDFAARYVAQLERENAFLRAVVEGLQQSEAQTKAALREVLKAQPRQLEQGNAAPPIAQDATQTPAPTNTANQTPEAVKTPQNAKSAAPKQEPRPLWKVILGLR